MKRTLSILMALLLALSLTACGGSAKSLGGSTASQNSDSSIEIENNAADYGWYEAPAEAEPASAVSDGSGQNVLANAKIIYTADMELETKEFDSASLALDQIVEGLGGYFECRSLYQGGSYRRLDCTIRVPAEQFSQLLDQAGQIAHVTCKDEYSNDVSEAYYDNEARLATQRTKLERLQALLEQAATMEDIIELENAISDTELQIEYLTGALRKYDSLIGYSTVTLRLREVYRLSTDEEPAVTFGQRFSSALSMGLERGIVALEDLTLGIARNWAALVFLAAVAAAVILLLRRRRRKKRHTPTPPPPAGTDDHGGSE